MAKWAHVLGRHPSAELWWRATPVVAPAWARPVVVGVLAGAASPFMWIAAMWKGVRRFVPCPAIAAVVTCGAMVVCEFALSALVPEVHDLLQRDPEWLTPVIAANAAGWTAASAGLHLARAVLPQGGRVGAWLGTRHLQSAFCGVVATAVAVAALGPITTWKFGKRQGDAWFDRRLPSVDSFTIKALSAAVLVPAAALHTYLLLPLATVCVGTPGARSPWPARVVPTVLGCALLWKPALHGLHSAFAAADAAGSSLALMLRSEDGGALAKAPERSSRAGVDPKAAAAEERRHAEGDDVVVNVGFRTVLCSVVSVLSRAGEWSSRIARELLLGTLELAMPASQPYFQFDSGQEFVPVGDRLSLPFIKWRLRCAAASMSPDEADVLFRSAEAIVDAQAALMLESDPAPLVKTIERNVPLHRAAFQLALHAIYLEPTCRAFLERVAEVTESVRKRHGLRPAQTTSDLHELFIDARAVHPRFERIINALAKASGGNHIRANVKSPVRVIEKTRLHADPLARGSYDKALDVVRGGIEYSSTSKLMQALELLLALDVHERDSAKLQAALLGDVAGTGIVIVRIKDRFNSPNPSGYADTMVNFYLADDPEKHIMELQLMHQQLMTVRREQGSHRFNAKTRSATELLESAGMASLIPPEYTVGAKLDLPPKYVHESAFDELSDVVQSHLGWPLGLI